MKDSFSFGAKVTFAKARIVLLPVPWEVTTSGGQGTAEAPFHIREASHQMDFFTRDQGAYNHLLYFCEPDPRVQKLNKAFAPLAKRIIENWSEDQPLKKKYLPELEKINRACETMVCWVRRQSEKILSAGKIPVLVGGDHSVSEGLLKLLSEQTKGHYGILHIDAHLDLREAFQSFKHSHGSVMHNVLSHTPAPEKLVQVGIRDFCKAEYSQKQKKLIWYFDEDLQKRLFSGESWLAICKEIVSHLPEKIYISIDMDGLEWAYAPGTGTPVPGGLSYNQVLFLLKEIKKQNKEVLGFDLVEAACPEKLYHPHNCWNGNVPARLIYLLCGVALAGQKETHL